MTKPNTAIEHISRTDVLLASAFIAGEIFITGIFLSIMYVGFNGLS